MTADKKTLGDLHDELAKDLLDRVINGEEEVVAGEVVKVSAKPATLNVARQFLKDNGIQAVVTPNNPLGKLANALPTFTEDEETLTQ